MKVIGVFDGATHNAEESVRGLRANIYGECTDKNWQHSREFIDEHGRRGGWMREENIIWLIAHQPKPAR